MTGNQKHISAAVDGRYPGNAEPVIITVILSCFFVSGMTGLIYEILWTRMIVAVIGSAPFAVSIVLTVFMAGLGLGSYLGGRWVDRRTSPAAMVKAYALLEIAVAGYSLLLPMGLDRFRPLFAWSYNRLFDNAPGYQILTLIGCTMLLMAPATAMGATLPILSRFFIRTHAHVGRRLGGLYGLNTLGAAAGALLCGFLLIRMFGIHGTLGFAVTCNLAVGIGCLVSARGLRPKRPDRNIQGCQAADPSRPGGPEAPGTGHIVVPTLLIAAVSGFCTLAYEVIWTRLLGLIVGPTTYSFTIILTTFIAGLAVGGIVFGRIADRCKPAEGLLLMVGTQVIAAASALAVSQFLGNSQIFFAKLIVALGGQTGWLDLLKAVALFITLLPTTVFLGATFPLAGKLYTRSVKHAGRSVGTIAAINTAGAVAGACCAGFVLIPLLGKEGGLRLLAALQLLTAAFAGVGGLRQVKTRRPVQAALALTVLLSLLLAAHYPRWNRLMLASGKYHRFQKMEHQPVGWIESVFAGMAKYAALETDTLAFYGDGIGGFTAVLKSGPDILGRTDYTLLNNGKADAASTRSDMCTQTLLAHFPLIFHPKPADVLVIGLGSGITAGEVLHYPVDRLDIIEINDRVVAASRFFDAWNNGVLSDPKTSLILQDGRAHLTLTDRSYDVIISEPSNPWMAGLAALFTREFMQLAKRRLKPDGFFVQWFHSYQMNWNTFALIGRTFAEVFPNSLLLSTNPGRIGPDFLLVGINGDARFDAGVARENFRFARESRNMSLNDATVFVNQIISEDLPALFGAGTLNTDNRPLLEYAAPRLMHVDISAAGISEKLASTGRFSAQTDTIVRRYLTDVDRQIDYAAYILSFRPYDKNQVDLSAATVDQKSRLAEIVASYCAANILDDLSFLPDDDLKQRCIDAALDTVGAQIRKHPDRADRHAYRGWLYYESGRHEAAADSFLRALAIDPDDDALNVTLGRILATLPDAAARERVEQQIVRHPGNPAFAYQMGVLLEKNGKRAPAATAYQTILAKHPDFVPALNALALAHMRDREYGRSLSLLQRVIALQPANGAAHYNIACLYALQGDSENALRWLERALEKGFTDWRHIMSDADISTIRDNERFVRLKNRYER